MPNPSDAFAGSSVGEHVTGRSGVDMYRRRWSAENPHASALILHGIAEHSARYEHVGATLAAAGFETISYDHRGFGRSGGKRGHIDSYDGFHDDVEDNLALLREEGRPVVLVAHSLGGLIASGYVVSGRPAPDVLILSGPAINATVPAWQRIMAPILGRVIPKLFITSEFDGGLLSTDPDVGAAYEGDPLRVKGSTAAFGLATFTAMDFASENLSKLSVPTMVVHGGNDRIVPASVTEAFEGLPNTTRVVLDGLEHEVLNEPNWEETVASMVTFANSHIG